MSKINLNFAFKLPPKEAIKYFQSKGNAPSWNWYEVWQEAHAKVFTVAKVTRLDILTSIRDMVQKALNEGITFQQFQKELIPKLIAQGWWGKDKDTGAQLGSINRLRTILNVNLNVAYSAGRYKQMMENTDSRPWWQYWAVGDNRTRLEHMKLNKLVFRYDDPFWKYFYPPNGWRCRCKVKALSDRNLERGNFKPITSEGNLKTENRVISKKTGEQRPVSVFINPETRFKTAPDAGWSYNPGEAWQADLGKYPNDLRMLFENDGSYDINPKFKEKIDGKIQAIKNNLESWKSWKITAKKYIYNLPDNEFYKIHNNGEDRRPDQTVLGFLKGEVIYIRNDIAMNIATGDKEEQYECTHTISHENIHSANPYGYTGYFNSRKVDKELDSLPTGEKKKKEVVKKILHQEKERVRAIEDAITELLTKLYLSKKEKVNIYDIDASIYLRESTNLLLNLIQKTKIPRGQLRDFIEDELYKIHTGTFTYKRKQTEDINPLIDLDYNDFLQNLFNNGIIVKETYEIQADKEKYLQEELIRWFIR